MQRERGAAVARIVVALAAVSLMAGCTNLQKGAAIGGAAGAGLGAGYGAIAGGVNAGEGALAGGLGGAVVGALIGSDMDLRGKADKRELENLQNQINAKEDCCDELRKAIDDLKRRLDDLEKKCAEEKKPIVMAPPAKEIEGFKPTARGYEMTILGDTLFRPGKADLSDQGRKTLQSVAKTIQEKFPGKEVSIEGHTDNQPIKYSGWRSNWELGGARAEQVLHFFEELKATEPAKLSAVTFGQYRPVEPNTTKQGMQQNRRAVIVILDHPADALANQGK